MWRRGEHEQQKRGYRERERAGWMRRCFIRLFHRRCNQTMKTNSKYISVAKLEKERMPQQLMVCRMSVWSSHFWCHEQEATSECPWASHQLTLHSDPPYDVWHVQFYAVRRTPMKDTSSSLIWLDAGASWQSKSSEGAQLEGGHWDPYPEKKDKILMQF